MIHFWTDIRPGEPDILTPLKDATLVLEDEDPEPESEFVGTHTVHV